MKEGKPNWWLPVFFFKRFVKGVPSGKVGGLFDITIHGICPIRFAAKTLEATIGRQE